eukprot:scaffold3579_cov30-Tisochrysis_lutea.AAC.1
MRRALPEWLPPLPLPARRGLYSVASGTRLHSSFCAGCPSPLQRGFASPRRPRCRKRVAASRARPLTSKESSHQLNPREPRASSIEIPSAPRGAGKVAALGCTRPLPP